MDDGADFLVRLDGSKIVALTGHDWTGRRMSELNPHYAAPVLEVLRQAVRLYHDLTQILRLCLSGPFDPKTASPGLVGLLARAADVPNFATLDAFIAETQAKVRASFNRILGASA